VDSRERSSNGRSSDRGGESNSSRPGNKSDDLSTFSVEAREADADLSLNVDLNHVNIASSALDKKYELRGSMGSFQSQGVRRDLDASRQHSVESGLDASTEQYQLQRHHLMKARTGSRSNNVPASARSREQAMRAGYPRPPGGAGKLARDEPTIDDSDWQGPGRAGENTDEGNTSHYNSVANRQMVKN